MADGIASFAPAVHVIWDHTSCPPDRHTPGGSTIAASLSLLRDLGRAVQVAMPSG